MASPQAVIDAFRAAFPIAVKAHRLDAYPDSDSLRFRSLAVGRVTDGEVTLHFRGGGRQWAAAANPAAAAGLRSERGYCTGELRLLSSVAVQRARITIPRGNRGSSITLSRSAHRRPTRTCCSTLPNFQADIWTGTRSIWTTPSRTQVSQANPAQITPVDFNFLPNHVVFRGMPDPRWWNFEDAVTDFGQLDADHVDLAKLLVMEFALVYGNDWFSVPVPTPIGTLERVTTLVVTDTFGVRTADSPLGADAGEPRRDAVVDVQALGRRTARVRTSSPWRRRSALPTTPTPSKRCSSCVTIRRRWPGRWSINCRAISIRPSTLTKTYLAR